MGSDESVPAAFALTIVDGHGLLSYRATPSSPEASPPGAGTAWAVIEALDLEVSPDTGWPAGNGAGTSATLAGLQSRRLALRQATLSTSVSRLAGALLGCPLAHVGVTEARVWTAPDGPRLGGRFKVNNREAPFTIRMGMDPRADGRRRLRINFADVRLFAHLPLPAPLVGTAIARGIGMAAAGAGPAVRALGPAIDIDPLELTLVGALVARGWRLPNIKRGWLESVDRTNGHVRLHFGCDGHPTEKMATLEQNAVEPHVVTPPLPFLEGERLPEALMAAEERLQAGDLVAAETGYRQALIDNPDDRAAHARLLALRVATGGADATQISGAMMLRWPNFLPGFLQGAIAALESGDPLRAAALFGRVAALADERGEVEDAALARAAAGNARARADGARTPARAGATPDADVPKIVENVADTPPPVGPTKTAEGADVADIAQLTEQAIARGALAEADVLFGRRLALIRDEQEAAALTAERARVQLLGPGGAPRALHTLREIALALTPEEGLVLRADLAERVGDLADARQTVGELVTRAVAAGDMQRARELSAHQSELSGAHAAEPAPPAEPDAQGIVARTQGGDSGSVTAKTEAVYATRSDPESRAEALGDLLQGFERLEPSRQHAAYASFGRVAESTGDLEYAEEAYWRATRVEGDPVRRANDLMAHARVLQSRGNMAAAVTELEQALALDPEHAGVLALLANQAFAAHDWERARALYARLDRAADAATAADVITRETLVHRRAVLARGAGDAAEAEACFRELAILNPRHIEARQALAQIAMERDDRGTAADRLGEVLRLLPLDALDALMDVRQRLGDIYGGLGDWGSARYYVELVLAQDPGRLPMVERLVEIYRHLGLYAAAADACDRLARLYVEPTKRAEALFRQGSILEEDLGDEARAFDAYLKSSDLDPTFTPTALRLVAGYWRRGSFGDVADVGEGLRRGGPLSNMDPDLRLRLALATALARRNALAGADVADLHATPWNADRAAVALAETAAHLSARPVGDLEPAATLLEAWQEATGASKGAEPTTDWLWAALRAQITKDPGATGAARALGWLADRKGDVHTARGLFATVVFVDEGDGVADRLLALGPAPTPTAAAVALGGPADHPGASGSAAALRRALEALARGLAGFGPLGPARRRTSTGDLGLRADRRDRLYALAKTLGAPPLALVTGAPRPQTPGDDIETPVAVTVVATRPATVEIPLVLTNIPEDELKFTVARAFDRLRGGLALVDTATHGTADDVASLLDGARAALTGAPAPDAPLAKSVAQELASPDRAAALIGASPRDSVIADLGRARDVLATWDAFRAAADRASDRFAILACRSPLAALRAIYRADAILRTDAVLAPGAAPATEYERRTGCLRTARVRELLRFIASDEYARVLTDAEAHVDDDTDG